MYCISVMTELFSYSRLTGHLLTLLGLSASCASSFIRYLFYVYLHLSQSIRLRNNIHENKPFCAQSPDAFEFLGDQLEGGWAYKRGPLQSFRVPFHQRGSHQVVTQYSMVLHEPSYKWIIDKQVITFGTDNWQIIHG